MIEFFQKLFDETGFRPRWNCGDWSTAHGWLHILSDLGVWSAYVAIPVVLIYFLKKRRGLPFRNVFWLFGFFILACGTTHLMEAIIFWHPYYRLAGLIKLFTAVISWTTVIAMVPIIPRALALPSNEQLQREIAARNQVENELHQKNLELKSRVDELRASQERFRLLVERTEEYGFYFLSPSGEVVTWNQGAERIKGYQADEIIGKQSSLFYPAEEITANKPVHDLQTALKQGRLEEESWQVRKDGSRFLANVLIAPLYDDEGTLRGYSKVTRDITERKAAEANARRLLEEEAARKAAEKSAHYIQQQTELMRVTFTSIGEAIIATDASGVIQLVNLEAQRLTGLSESRLVGKRLEAVLPIVHEESRQPLENPISRVFKTQSIVSLESDALLLAQDNEQCSIEGSASPIRDSQGQIVGAVLVFTDVTQRRKAERTQAALVQSLQESDDRLRLAVEVAGLGIVHVDYVEQLATLSPEAAEIYHLQAGVPVPRGALHERVHPDDRERVMKELDECLAGEGDGNLMQEYRIVNPDNSIRWLNVRKRVQFENTPSGRRPRSAIIVALDITNRKAADQQRDDFLATLAHELRNPLAPIRTGLELMRRNGFGGNGDGCHEVLGIMDRQINQMVRLVDDLLDVSRVSKGKIELRKQPVDVNDVLRSAVETSLPRIEEAHHQFELQISEQPLIVEGDGVRLAQVVSNLLNNAAKYTPSGGQIRLSLAAHDGQAVIRVKDNGVGIAAEMIPTLFDMFVQVDRHLERSQGGLGIGLTLVRQLVEMHGGRVEARSDGLGRGSEFIVYLPLAVGKLADASQPKSEHPAGKTPSLRVLVVDDNQDSAQSLVMMLEFMGHQVQSASDGPDGLAVATQFLPEVVLLDIGMPGMNGYEVARRMRTMPQLSHTLLVAQTGWGQEEDRRMSREAGFNHHLVKPIAPNRLIEILAEVAAAKSEAAPLLGKG